MSTNFAKTLVWTQDYDVKLWRHNQRTPNTNVYPTPLNETPHENFLRTPLSSPYTRGHQRSARGHQVAREDEVGRPRGCSKNNISMINVFTLANINTKMIVSKLSNIFYFRSVYQTSSPSH